MIGIGQAAFHMAGLLGQRFSVVTTLAVSVPVIEANIAGYGMAAARVRPSGIPVLALEDAGAAVMARLAAEIAAAAGEDDIGAMVLGCAGMAPLRARLQAETALPLIEPVAASALLALALAGYRRA